MRAAALETADLTDFVAQRSMREAAAVNAQAACVNLSERDSLRVLALLENPPALNAKLLSAAKDLPQSA
jgi:uncharacterized protein (DUF1778 family)